MANIFGFGTYGGILGHYFKFHIECNTFFSWFDYLFEYNEAENGVRIMMELCKIQLFLAISSNIQDVYNYTSTSYFLRQERGEDLPQIETLEDGGEI